MSGEKEKKMSVFFSWNKYVEQFTRSVSIHLQILRKTNSSDLFPEHFGPFEPDERFCDGFLLICGEIPVKRENFLISTVWKIQSATTPRTRQCSVLCVRETCMIVFETPILSEGNSLNKFERFVNEQ